MTITYTLYRELGTTEPLQYSSYCMCDLTHSTQYIILAHQVSSHKKIATRFRNRNWQQDFAIGFGNKIWHGMQIVKVQHTGYNFLKKKKPIFYKSKGCHHVFRNYLRKNDKFAKQFWPFLYMAPR